MLRPDVEFSPIKADEISLLLHLAGHGVFEVLQGRHLFEELFLQALPFFLSTADNTPDLLVTGAI